MRKFYVILSPWDEFSYRLIGWTENDYIANVYYDELSKDEDLIIVSYECENILTLSHILKEEYGIDVEDTANSKLVTRVSSDNKLYVVFRHDYLNWFNTDNIRNTAFQRNFSKIFLSSAPLVKYINGGDDLLLNTVFLAYQYLVKFDNENIKFDMVYLWYYILNVNKSFIVCTSYAPSELTIDKMLPENVVFLTN